MNKRQRKKAMKKYWAKVAPFLRAKAHHDIFCSTPLFSYLMAENKETELKQQQKIHDECDELMKEATAGKRKA